MFRSIVQFGKGRHVGRWFLPAAAVACLGLSGCANLDLRGERFQYDPAFELGSQLRPADNGLQPVAISNKSIQIERNLGVR